ncbi:hypothetical protein Nepgr_017897 [Nepenthes gracilis]|uniref:Peptidase A1 domain-containing protein n=1 Tax=Nepenthes gracilis TaxID=150966 RepID=A0AAD3STK9_NEPGR|nr:hypothetical protein Nepgr_017897 [Nepenthes gracilis]
MSNFYAIVLAIVLCITTLPTKVHGIRLEIVPIYGDESPFSPHNFSLAERHERILNLSIARAFQFHLLSSVANSSNIKNASSSTNDAWRNVLLPPVSRDSAGGLYTTKLLIGTQRWPANLAIDTGSDDTWVQTDECSHCFPLRGGGFKGGPLRAMHCAHPLCVPFLCDHLGMCRYRIEYLGGASTSGIVGLDFFHFPSGGHSFHAVPGIAFGCGDTNINIGFGVGRLGPNNIIAGVFGLGPGARSILTQLGPLSHKRFSYCMPSPTAPAGTQTYLHFGDDAHIRAPRVTPLVVIRSYYINIEGIGLEGRRLPIDPRLFHRVPSRQHGSVIDTGTGPSLLVPGAYDVVKTNVMQHMQAQYGLRPISHGVLPYDLCYSLRGRALRSPSMTIYLEGAELHLDPSTVFLQLSTAHCMTFMPVGEEGPNILGVMHQVNYRFLFDVAAGRLSFAPENCHGS